MRALAARLRPLLGTLAGLSFVVNLLYLVPALFMLQVFDRVLSSGSLETLVVLLAGTGIALAILLALDYVRTNLQHVVGSLVDEQLSPPVVRAVVQAAARSPGSAGVDAVRDVAALRAAFATNGLVALFDAPWVVIYVGVIWLCHPYLGMGAAIASALMLLLAWANDRVSRRALEALQGESRRASQYVETSLRNAEVLQALGMTGNLLERWRAMHGRVAAAGAASSRTNVAFSSGTRVFRQSVQILMLALGAWLVLSLQASPGIMIATTILLGRALQPVEQLVGSWKILTEARAAYRRLSQLALDEPGEPRLAMPAPQGRVAVEGATYRVRGSETPVLAGITFSLAAGEALAVIGPSAAGKSTLARLLVGVWAPGAGTVRLDGADVAYWDRAELGPWVGYLPQDVELFDGTVAENIARLGPVDSQAVVEAARRACVHEMILALPKGYDTPIGAQGLRLSPGQRQRIALARALYGSPRLVVLDEPNSNLDGAGEIALAQALSGLRSAKVTSVIVTHRPSLIAHVDKVLVLAAGRIQQFGPAAQVMKAMQQQAQAMVDAKVA